MGNIDKAIEKLNSEECKDSVFKLKNLLIEKVKTDEHLATSILDDKKSMQTCFKYILEWARKLATNGCYVAEDNDVLSKAIHYFLDVEEKKIEPKPSTQSVRVPSLGEKLDEKDKNITISRNTQVVTRNISKNKVSKKLQCEEISLFD